jgi:uncharacterized phiE125 gp8 family phage protein
MLVEVLKQPVTAYDAGTHLRLPITYFADESELVYLEALLSAATDTIEGLTNRAVAKGRYVVVFLPSSSFGAAAIKLRSPLREVELVEAIASDGTATDFTDYNVVGDTITSNNWPENIRVTYVAGYDEAPYALKAAILLLVADLYENREGVGHSQYFDNPTLERLCAPWRLYS